MCVLSIIVMLFNHFGCHFAFWTQKVFIFDRFYNGFRNAFLVFEKPRFSLVLSGFSTWWNVMWILSINVMLFDHFRGHFAILTQKVFIFDRFYKGFRNAFLAFEKPRFSLVL